MGTTCRTVFRLSLALAVAIGVLCSQWASGTLEAATESELRSKIESRGKDIAALEAEIRSYEEELTRVGQRATTLESSLKRLDLTKRKLDADVRVTEGKIDAAELSIERAQIEIGTLGEKLSRHSTALKDTLKRIRDADGVSLIEAALLYPAVSNFWNDLEETEQFQEALRQSLGNVRLAKNGVEEAKLLEEKRARELTSLKSELVDRKKIVDASRAEERSLLTSTRNKEANFKRVLADKRALKDAFERELRDFESALRIAIDPSLLPRQGTGVLGWPLDEIRVTQKFGLTDFAIANVGLYGSAGHNGVDFAASVGTSVKASESGTVEGAGDTDTVCPGASYGKWVLIKHGNGLSTLYAHLSLIKAAPGQSIAKGETLGYSGATGYSTGPHLHFTVYASQGVAILERKSKVCKGIYRMPIADPRAYLDPLQYL